MNRALAISGAVMLIGIILLSNQGCNRKLLKPESEGERVSERVDTKPPSLSGESSSGELSGFSRNPSEERIAESGYPGALPPSDIAPPQRAELTKEEKAAVKACLQDVFFDFDQWTLPEAGLDARSIMTQPI